MGKGRAEGVLAKIRAEEKLEYKLGNWRILKVMRVWVYRAVPCYVTYTHMRPPLFCLRLLETLGIRSDLGSMVGTPLTGAKVGDSAVAFSPLLLNNNNNNIKFK